MQAHGTIGLKENYRIVLAETIEKEARDLEAIVSQARLDKDGEKAQFFLKKLNQRFGHKPIFLHNLVPTVGRAVLAQRLSGDTTYTGTINKCALGTGSTSPSNADTTLATESYRNNAASLADADNVAYITGFFTAVEVSGTFTEVGFFIDGTASANTGQLFSRALINVTKSGAQTLTIDATFTFS